MQDSKRLAGALACMLANPSICNACPVQVKSCPVQVKALCVKGLFEIQ